MDHSGWYFTDIARIHHRRDWSASIAWTGSNWCIVAFRRVVVRREQPKGRGRSRCRRVAGSGRPRARKATWQLGTAVSRSCPAINTVLATAPRKCGAQHHTKKGINEHYQRWPSQQPTHRPRARARSAAATQRTGSVHQGFVVRKPTRRARLIPVNNRA